MNALQRIPLFLISLLLVLASTARAENLVLFPLNLFPEDPKYANIFGASLQEGLQQRYDNVYFGPAVEAQLAVEYAKEECSPQQCTQNTLVNFNATKMAETSISKEATGYIIVLTITDILDTGKSIAKTDVCDPCTPAQLIRHLKKFGAKKEGDDATSLLPDTGTLRFTNIDDGITIIATHKNGNVSSHTTPISADGIKLAPGPYSLTLSKPGYDSVSLNIDIIRNQRTAILAKQSQLRPQLCTVEVTTAKTAHQHSAGAISISGKSNSGTEIQQKGTAPQTFSLPVGQYNIAIETTNYTGKDTVNCSDNSTHTTTIKLLPKDDLSPSAVTNFLVSYASVIGAEDATIADTANGAELEVQFLPYQSFIGYGLLLGFYQSEHTAVRFGTATNTISAVGAKLYFSPYLSIGAQALLFSESKFADVKNAATSATQVRVGLHLPLKFIRLSAYHVVRSGENTPFSPTASTVAIGIVF